MSDLLMRRSAEISDCGLYRYSLEREWGGGKGYPLTVCMLNPSTADAQRDDPTLLTLINFAKLWGFSGLYIVNLFAWRASSPAEMRTAADPVGPRNVAATGEAMLMAAITREPMLAAWGNGGHFMGAAATLIRRANDFGIDLVCLGETRDGSPKHPLARGRHRVPRDQQPLIWKVAA
ncbi:hypothetical protein HY78_14580 [Rhizorhabdus wittichii DC-6]|nr:hypothetical protein HY78_14580 [Rhizorhabdus wittichii DC-6]